MHPFQDLVAEDAGVAALLWQKLKEFSLLLESESVDYGGRLQTSWVV